MCADRGRAASVSARPSQEIVIHSQQAIRQERP